MPIFAVPSDRYIYTLPPGFETDLVTCGVQAPVTKNAQTTVTLRLDVRSMLPASDSKDKIDGLTSVLIGITVPHATLGTDIAFAGGAGSVAPPAGVSAGFSTRTWLVPVVKRMQFVIVGCHFTPTIVGVKTVVCTLQAVETNHPTVPESRLVTIRQPIVVAASPTSS